MNYLRIGFFLYICLNSYLISLSSTKDTFDFSYKEVVITALRYPEKIFEVPLSVTYISGKNYIVFRGLSIDEPLTSVPGVLVQQRSGSQDIKITVRGFGSRGAGDRSNSGTVRGLKFLLDGIPQTEPDGRTSLDLLDISLVENVEIIRSNASALWGNASGAIFSFTTVPSDNTPALNFSKSIGSWGLDKNVLKFKTSLGQNGVAYLNTVYSKFDGWRQNSNSEKFLVNFGIKVPLGFVNSKFKEELYSTVIQLNGNLAKNFFSIPGALTQRFFDTLPRSANPIYLHNKERRNNRLAQIGFSFTNNFNETTSLFLQGFLTSKYLQRSERGTFRDFTRYFVGSSAHLRHEFNIQNLNNILLIGIDDSYQDGAILFYELDSNANRSTKLRTNKKEGAFTYGMFFQNEILWQDMSVILGLRYDNVTYHSQDFLVFSSLDEKKFGKIIPKIGINYRLLENLSIFANLGGGIEVPAGNETDPMPGEDTIFQINPLLNPIISKTYEVGFKSFFILGSLIKTIELESSLFKIDTKNELIPYRQGKFYLSAGRTSRIGFEGMLKTTLPMGIKFNATFSYLIGKFDDYIVDSSLYDKNKAGIYADFKGNSLPGVPKYYYYASITIPFVVDFEFYVNGVSKYFCDDANKIEVPSYDIFNFRILYEKISIGKKINISLAFSVNNLFDKKYVGSSFLNPIYEKGTNLPYFIEPGLPRNYLFSISFQF